MGIRIPTLFSENDAKRCAGCGEPIEGTPFRVSLLGQRGARGRTQLGTGRATQPGTAPVPLQPECFRAWAQGRGHYLCRLSQVRELMRPTPLPVDPPAWGLCDGNHREDHEFEPA